MEQRQHHLDGPGAETSGMSDPYVEDEAFLPVLDAIRMAALTLPSNAALTALYIVAAETIVENFPHDEHEMMAIMAKHEVLAWVGQCVGS
jgi:hypothetical protein